MTSHDHDRLRELRRLVTIDREAVAARAADGDRVAAHVLEEADYLAADAPGAVPTPLTDLPLSPTVLDKALTAARDDTSILSRRVLRRLGLGTLDYVQASRLARRVAALPDEAVDTLRMPRLKVAVLGTVTTDYLSPVLEASLYEHGIAARVRNGTFGQLEETVLDQASWLAEFKPDIVVVWDSSLALAGASESWPELAERRASLSSAIAERFSADTVITLLEPLPEGSPPWIEQYNSRLREALPDRGHVFDTAALARELGDSQWFDLRLWSMAGQASALNAVPVLGDRLAAFIRALVDPPIRLIVTDLDDTIWGGKVAEVGSAGLELSGAHVRLQELLQQCVERGILVAAVSKNTGDAARAVFGERAEMVLQLEDFVEFDVSFVPKSIMVAQIAERLGLGLQNVLFLDNDEHERAEMRERCPDVIVPEWPNDGIAGVPGLLARRGWTVKPRVTAADRERLGTYRNEAARRQAVTTFANLDEFLSTLGLEARFERIGAPTLDRVVQLVNKTNQFNLTTRRRTRREVEEMLAIPGSYAATVDVSDRYGPYGLTGVMVAVPDGTSLAIDLWLLSCRVMGKTIEHAMFEHLLRHARARGFETIVGTFRPTERNGAISSLLSDLGFHFIAAMNDEQRYEFRVRDDPAQPNRHVTVTEGVLEEVHP